MVSKNANSAYARGESLLQEKRPDEHDNLKKNFTGVAQDVADYVIGFCYGEVWTRESGLSLEEKALTTVSCLAAQGEAAEPQFRSHVGGALKSGCNPEEVLGATYWGARGREESPVGAMKIAREIFTARGIAGANDMSMEMPPRVSAITFLTGIATRAATADDATVKMAVLRASRDDTGLSRKDIIDTLIHIIPYAGFPRAINAIKTAQGVFEGLDKKKTNEPAVPKR